VLALLVQGYSSYRYTDVLENMNGRYLLPILLFVAAIVGRALSIQLRKSSSRRVIFSVVIVFLFLEGGGIFTFIDRSDQTWDVSNSAVVKANNIARHITKPVIVDGKSQYTTSRWFFN
jgi:predicted permease